MSLICPECEGSSFEVIDSVECGPDGSADENTIQRAHCKECDGFFVCTYKETRSYRSDRDDRVTHLAFITDPNLWAGSAKIFEKPSGRVSSGVKITAAKIVLRMAQETGASGKHIAYASVTEPHISVPTKRGVIAEMTRKLTQWFGNKR